MPGQLSISGALYSLRKDQGEMRVFALHGWVLQTAEQGELCIVKAGRDRKRGADRKKAVGNGSVCIEKRREGQYVGNLRETVRMRKEWLLLWRKE